MSRASATLKFARRGWILGTRPLLSGLNFWTRRMTLILLGFRRFAAIWTRTGDQRHAPPE
ncbi:hypothetical protein CFBP5473_06695 [Agrobacterium larrymoorei]|uniref:Uncharacterized protein n=1 Tax=Agrobacterium larrymoorei TaxID=160699 RepID=A0A4D7DRM4_9HYPH|nr:hypothetical protein CFBP5473_06695 [Agrobacterium larrymoorei]